MLGAIVILCLVLVTSKFPATESKLSVPYDWNMDSNLTKLVLDIKYERYFRTLIVLREYEDDCGFVNNLRQLKVPKLLLKLNQTFYLKGNYSSEALAMVCLSQAVNVKLIKKLSENLNHMRSVQILFVWKQNSYELPGYMRHLQQLAELCNEYDMLHVIMVFHDFPLTHKYFSYHRFPELFVESRSFLHRTGTIYPKRLKNLHGQPIFTVTDWVEPRSMLYYEKNGTIKRTGYMMKFLYTFIETINATVIFPVPNTRSIYMEDLLNLTRSKTVDFALSLLNPKILMNMQEYTYPVETAVWTIIWPNEPIMAPSELFFHILETRTAFVLSIVTVVFSTLVTLTSANWHLTDKRKSFQWLACIINSKSLRAMLGQSFTLSKNSALKHRLCLLMTIIAGFIVSNMYSAFLGSVFVEPPSEHRMRTYEDILKSPIKIAMVQRNVPEVQFIKGPDYWPKYSRCFHIIDTYEEFLDMRHAMNTSYGYSIMSSLIPVLKQLQHHFARHLFRVSEDIIFDSFNIVGMPIPENSVYKEVLNNFIGETRSYGLMDHWFISTFSDMLESGKITLEDKSQPHVVDAMKVDDFIWIWHGYIFANFMALIVFGLEQLVFKWKMRRLYKQRQRRRRTQQHNAQINFGGDRKELEETK